jgi:uncharacterized protein GlcG (DUF336 family)
LRYRVAYVIAIHTLTLTYIHQLTFLQFHTPKTPHSRIEHAVKRHKLKPTTSTTSITSTTTPYEKIIFTIDAERKAAIEKEKEEKEKQKPSSGAKKRKNEEHESAEPSEKKRQVQPQSKSQPQQTSTLSLSHSSAQLLSKECIKQADEMQQCIAIAICDENKQLLHFSRMDPVGSAVAVSPSAALALSPKSAPSAAIAGEAMKQAQEGNGQAILFQGIYVGAIAISGASNSTIENTIIRKALAAVVIGVVAVATAV